MKILPLFSGCCLFVSTVAGQAELPRYSVEKVSSFFPLLGPDQGVYGSGTNLNGVSAGGTDYMATFTDFANPATPPGSQLSPHPKLAVRAAAASPSGYVTGTSGALRSSS